MNTSIGFNMLKINKKLILCLIHHINNDDDNC